MVLVLPVLSEPTALKELLPAHPALMVLRPLLLLKPLLLTAQLTATRKMLDVSLALVVAMTNAQNAMPVIMKIMVPAPNAVLELTHLQDPSLCAQNVPQEQPPLMAQKFKPIVKPVTKRKMDVSLALQLMLVNAQNAMAAII